MTNTEPAMYAERGVLRNMLVHQVYLALGKGLASLNKAIYWRYGQVHCVCTCLWREGGGGGGAALG